MWIVVMAVTQNAQSPCHVQSNGLAALSSASPCITATIIFDLLIDQCELN